MNNLRPSMLDSALRQCLKSPRSAAYRSHLQRNLQRRRRTFSRPQQRWISDGTRPPLPPGVPEKSRVVAPKTRLAVGVVFIGALIYSMVTGEKPPPIEAPTMDPPSGPPSDSSPNSTEGSQSSPTGTQQLEAPSIADRDTLTRLETDGVIDSSSPMRLRMEKFILENQKEIVRQLEAVDGTKFHIDQWDRPKGGGGITCVLQDGNVFEKAGVNTSVVYGTLPRAAISKMRVHHKALDPSVESLDFFAAGLSLVLHPINPMAPTVHLNYRYFETANPADGSTNTWWFGGGTDLTPSYLFEEDVKFFHQGIKGACDGHDGSYYPRFKKWCDDYFRVTHRGENRGVGGIFFDDLDSTEKGQEELFSFIQSCLGAFLPSYLPILKKRKDMPYGEREKQWQQLRRGRYVEFNLVHDRGTAFGLNTPGARIESILMSLPLTARWQYQHEPEPGSREEKMLSVLKTPKEWV